MKVAANFLIALAITGICVIAYWLLLWIRFGGAVENWTSLGTPPEKAVKLSGADLTKVYVQALSGQVYVCEQFSIAPPQCWRKVDRVELSLDPYPCTLSPSDLLKPPEQIIDRVDVYFCGADTSTEANYAVLSDGSVWNRRHGTAANFLVYSLIYGSQGVLIIAFLLGLWIQRKPKSAGAA